MKIIEMERNILRKQSIPEISDKIDRRIKQLDFIMERFIDSYDEQLVREEFKYTRFLRAKTAEYSELTRLNRLIQAKGQK